MVEGYWFHEYSMDLNWEAAKKSIALLCQIQLEANADSPRVLALERNAHQ
jgi:hypothetical protein